MPLFSDPLNADYIITHAGLKPLVALLMLENINILADTITSLLYLNNNQIRTELSTAEVVQRISDIQKSNDKRLVNLATIFLQDVCCSSDQEQV